MRRKFLALVFSLGMTMSLASCGTQGPKGETGEKGEPGKDGVSIKSISKTGSNGNIDTYTITYSDGSTSTFSITNGIDGQPGANGIQGEPGEDGHTPDIKIGSNGNWWIDGVDSGISAKGEDGNGITSIKKTSSDGNVDTYTITYSNGITYDFTVTNGEQGIQGIQGEPGKDGHTPKIEIGTNGNWWIDGVDSNIKAQGPIGPQGPQGEQGEPGKDGASVSRIEKTDSNGNVDTYTIYFSDGTTATFTVTNGQDGEQGIQGIQGIQGEPGKDGHTPDIKIGTNGNWWIDGKDTGVSAKAPNRNDQFTVKYYLNGGSMPSGTSTSTTVYWGNTLTLPIPTRKGYAFKGWFTGDTANDKQFFNTDAVFNDLSLYAKWEIGTYTLTLDLDGGTYSGPTKYTFKYGDNYKIPENIYKKGFIFEGRTLNGESFLSSGTYYYENITVKATYTVSLEHTINLNLNGGTFNGSKEIKVKTNEEYILPREGVTNGDLVFVGWFNGAEKREDKGIYPLKEDIYLAAKREALDTYNLTIDYNGGISSGASSITITNKDFYDGKKTILPIAAKEGYDLYGYSVGNYLVSKANEPLDFDLLRNVFGRTKDLSLTAKYIGKDEKHLGDYYCFGSYPQTKEKNLATIEALGSATDTDGDGYLNLGNDEYKEVIKTDSTIKEFFKVEPIVWEVKEDGTLVSSMILDSSCYNFTSGNRTILGVQVHGNNYKYSTIRAFLNSYDGSSYKVGNYTGKGFYDVAFTEEEKSKILENTVDNSLNSTSDSNNPYICEDTNDKIFLLSREEYTREYYGYKQDKDRMRRGTDYAVAKGLSVYNIGRSYYWTRSPDSSASNFAYRVYSDGRVGFDFVYSSNVGVLPALKISK